MPILELVTTGNKSGKPRSILISYVDTPTGPALAGTNVGSDSDPAWIRNLRAQPRARVRKAGEWSEVRARFLEGSEWEQVWSHFTRHSGYAGYREMTHRSIPIVVLESQA